MSSLTNYSGKMKSSDEFGNRLYCKYWRPRKIKNLVFISHGFGDHHGSYREMATKLASLGSFVFMHDHEFNEIKLQRKNFLRAVGHGKSKGERVDVRSFKIYVNDVIRHVSRIKKSHRQFRCFIIGHSMGGAIAILSIIKKPKLFSGAVFISPAIKPSSRLLPSSYKMFKARLASVFSPHSEVAFINLRWTSSNLSYLKEFANDKFGWHGGLKARWAICMVKAMEKIKSKAHKIKIPFMIMHGTSDKVCSIDGSSLFYDSVSSEDKTFKIIEGGYHQLHHEPNDVGFKMVSDLAEWIKYRT